MKYLFSLALLLLTLPLGAQRHQTFNDRIQSVTVIANDNWQSLPIYELDNGAVSIDFDDLTHEYHRYAYRLEHCEADWTPSDQLFESDFCEGFADGNTIDNTGQSTLTNTLYTHYRLTLPNQQCRPKISGNYRLTVYDDNDNDRSPLLEVCFMVTEPGTHRMGVSLQVTGSTDATIHGLHQQVAMAVNYGPYSVTRPSEQLHTVLLQNGRWDDARRDATPQYVMADGLKWDHNPAYIFLAGNEYRKFEILSTDVASMGIDHIGWDGADYHAYPFEALPRPNYLYDEDADGAFLIRNSDNIDIDTESDYMNVHFQLQTDHPLQGEIYLNGWWTFDRFLPKYKMEYNNTTHIYEASVPLKLGYYSYQYLLVNNGKARPLPSEGCFWQTENRYQALVYFRPTGGRTDKLVGYNETTFQTR